MHVTRLLPLLLLVLPAGCAYPIYKQLKPAADVSVQDANGVPITGAKVHLGTTIYPYGDEGPTEVTATDTSGIARFYGKNEWRTESMMLHGAQVFDWRWCVAKPGYETRYLTYEDWFNTKSPIVLREGVSQPCKEPEPIG